MNLSIAARTLLLAVSFSAASLHAVSQSLPIGVTPQMLDQLRAMSPAEQQALARQYNFTLPPAEASASSQFSGLARPGERLPTPMLPQVTIESSIPLGMTPADIKAATPDKPEEVKTRARTRYGRTLFSRDVSTFAPTDDAPVPETYRLGVGDQLLVQLFGKENEQLSLQIGRLGDVSFPKLGAITLAGLTFEDARDLIKTRVEQQFIGVDAVVTMGRLRAINVFMAGEVFVPGAYSVSAMTSVTQALFQAGGVTDIGSLRNIQVRRGGSVVSVFDTYDLLLRGDLADDMRLQSGDIIFVPPYSAVIDVQGEVKRPMVYELAGDETMADVLAMAGSFTRNAYPAQAILTRQSDVLGLPQVSTVNLSDPNQLAQPVQDGDTLQVPKVGDLLAGSISLKGAVMRPGSYGWVPGMRVSDVLGDARRDLSRDADLSLGIIVRQTNTLLDIEVIDFDLGATIASPGTQVDPELREFDEVLVLPIPAAGSSEGARKELLKPILEKLSSQARKEKPVQTVSISGAVKMPGTYPLFAGATVETLVAVAGGLRDSAFVGEGELRRLTEKTDGAIISVYTDVSIAGGASNEQISLLSRDHLTVREVPNWSPEESMVIEGEVRFPGTYRIKKGEKLSDLIGRAGGFTEVASPQSAVFTRVSVAQREAERIQELSREIRSTFATRLLTEETSSKGIQEVEQIVSALESSEGKGRLLVDLVNAMAGDLEADIEVEDGDLLVIPARSNTISVVGEVKRQGTHAFQSEFDLDDYLDLSAGVTRRADKGGVYIVKGNGVVVTTKRDLWRFTAGYSSLEPGDTIVVPINTQYKDTLAGWRDITEIVYQSVVSIAAIASL